MRNSRWVTVVVSIALLVALSAPGCTNGDSDSASDADESSGEIEQDGLEVGTQAPDFRLKNQDQETVVLADYIGASNVVLVFYPLAFTPV